MPSTPSPPPVPDPFAVAGQQQQLNTDTMNQMLAASQTNQQTPFGSLTYNQSGVGPNGVPTYTATSQLTPQQQMLLNIFQGSQFGAGESGQNLMGNTMGQYSTAPNLSDQAGGLTQQLLGQQTSYLKPYFDQQNEQLDSTLRNQGVFPGSPAYDNAISKMRDDQNRAVTGFLTQAEPQAFQQAQQQYTLPLTMIQQLMGMSAPASLPASILNTPQASGKAADLTGAVASANQANMAAYQQQIANNNAMLGGVFGIGKAIAGNPQVAAALML